MLISDRRSGPAPPRDLVVIGASAGGVEALKRIVADLPGDLPAAVCVVLHIAPGSPSALAAVLSRSGPLPCHTPRDGDRLRPGEIIVGVPGHHLVIEEERVRLTVGPRENGHRPAVNVLFRTAAAAAGARVVGVVLSGSRDDGAAGLAAIKAGGGATIVQDPEEAMYPGMPTSALAQVQADLVAPSSEIGAAVVAAVTGAPPWGPPGGSAPAGSRRPGGGRARRPGGSDRERLHAVTGTLEPGGEQAPVKEMTAAERAMVSICPECGGVLTETAEAGVAQWRCRVGHSYSVDSLLDAQADSVERALWTAVRVLEDRRVLLEQLAERLEHNGNRRSAGSLRRRALAIGEQAEVVRSALAGASAAALGRGESGESGETRG
jgi:two-component system chemotaxis response regulator CheB